MFEKVKAVTLVQSKYKFAIRGPLELISNLLFHLSTYSRIVVELPIDNNMEVAI